MTSFYKKIKSGIQHDREAFLQENGEEAEKTFHWVKLDLEETMADVAEELGMFRAIEWLFSYWIND